MEPVTLTHERMKRNIVISYATCIDGHYNNEMEKEQHHTIDENQVDYPLSAVLVAAAVGRDQLISSIQHTSPFVIKRDLLFASSS